MNAFAVRNPRTGKNDTLLPLTTVTELAALADKGRIAQIEWAALAPVARASILQQWQQSLKQHRRALIQALATDTGRLRESELEFDTVQSTLDRWCRQAPELLQESDPIQGAIPNISISNQAIPYPLVGIISPWNFPLLLSLIDAIPGLLAGSAVILKPSEITPRFAEVLRTSLESVPQLAHLVSIAQGGSQIGAALLEQVDMVIFTGSVATGRQIGEAATRNFIPAFLELSGKDAALVMEDADIERCAAAITWGGMVNAGQSCMSIERVYVAQSQHDAFVEALAHQVSRLRCNIEKIEKGEIGPLIAERQAKILDQHLRDACSRGAHVVVGGKFLVSGVSQRY